MCFSYGIIRVVNSITGSPPPPTSIRDCFINRGLGNPRVLLLVCITFSYRVCCLTITALRQRCSSLRNSAPDLLTEHASQPQKLSHPLHLLSRCANISSAQWSCQLPSCPLMHRHPRTAPGVRVILPALMGLPPHSTFEEDPVCGHMM